MTFPNTYIGIKRFIVTEILMMVSEVLTIIFSVLTITVYRMNVSLDNITDPVVSLLFAVTLLLLVVRICSYIFCIFGLRRASKDDANFKIAFYSIVITLILAVGSLMTAFNKEISNISELLIILTVMMGEIYILEGIRSLCLQIGHPEMDKTGAILYAIIITVFVIRTCICIIVLVLDSGAVTVEASFLGMADCALSIIESILFLFYYAKALTIFSKE